MCLTAPLKFCNQFAASLDIHQHKKSKFYNLTVSNDTAGWWLGTTGHTQIKA